MVTEKRGQDSGEGSQTRGNFVNFKNATNVSAADSVARGASIYMRPRAKLGDRVAKERSRDERERAFD